MPRLDIRDKTGHHTIIEPNDIAGELWIDGEYSGMFIIYGDSILINLDCKMDVFIRGWQEWDWYGGRE